MDRIAGCRCVAATLTTGSEQTAADQPHPANNGAVGFFVGVGVRFASAVVGWLGLGDLLAVDAKLRAAFASLIVVANDQNVRGWIIDTASILAPLAVPDQRKTGKKRRRYGKQ